MKHIVWYLKRKKKDILIFLSTLGIPVCGISCASNFTWHIKMEI